MEYYLLYAKEEGAIEIDIEWRNKNFSLFCKECTCLPINHKIPRFKIANSPTKAALNFINEAPDIYTISESLFKAIGENDIKKNFKVCTLYSNKGVELDFPIAIKANKIVTVRGNEKSRARMCSSCKNIYYSPSGRWYLLENDIAGIEICQSQLGLVVSTNFLEKIQLTKQKKLGFTKLNIRSEAIDNLQEIFNK